MRRRSSLRYRRFLAAALFTLAGIAGPGSADAQAVRGPGAIAAPVFEYRFGGVVQLPIAEIKALTEETLDRFEDDAASECHLDDAAYSIRHHYRSRGYARVEVTFAVTREGTATIVTFTVREGLPVQILRISVTGADRIPPEQLLGEARLGRLQEGRVYIPLEVEREVKQVWGVLLREGFVDSRVRLRVSPGSPPEQTVCLELVVHEGPQVFLKDVVFEGNERVSSDVLRKEMAPILRPVRPFSRILAEQARARLLDIYGRLGYPFAEVRHAVTFDRGQEAARFRLLIEEGALARFGKVTISGNDDTLESVIRGQMLIEEDAPFDEDAVWKSQIRLYDTALFRRVKVARGVFRPDPDEPGQGALDYEVDLEELPPWRFDFFVGYGTYDRIRGGASIRHTNVFGTGRAVELAGMGSSKSGRVELNVTDSLTTPGPSVLRWRNFYDYRVFPSFDRTEWGTWLEGGYPLSRQLEVRTGYRYVRSRASDVTDPLQADRESSVGISGPTFGVTWDSRDDPVSPVSGALIGATYELAAESLGGEISFHRVAATVRGHVALNNPGDWVLVGAARGGVIIPFGDTDGIPIQERYFSGGATTVRSFAEFELGPQSLANDPLGGEAYLVLNAELRFPIYRRLHGAAFVDAGNVQPRWEDFGLDDMSYGIGGGLRFKTPVGPVRVDAAVNPDPNENEDDWRIHLSVGYAF